MNVELFQNGEYYYIQGKTSAKYVYYWAPSSSRMIYPNERMAYENQENVGQVEAIHNTFLIKVRRPSEYLTFHGYEKPYVRLRFSNDKTIYKLPLNCNFPTYKSIQSQWKLLLQDAKS